MAEKMAAVPFYDRATALGLPGDDLHFVERFRTCPWRAATNVKVQCLCGR